jgi:alkylation response protein AidB-like acyl-CoA dehydrogenase
MTTITRQGVTADDSALAQAIATFAAAELAPRAAQLDEEEASVTRHLPQLGALGVMGMNLPERWGGPGVSYAGMLLGLIEVSRACAATSSMIGAHYLATDAVLIAGNDAQRERYLPRAATGALLGAFALTEPGGGSNPADMTTTATRSGDAIALRGTKQFISNADEAGFIVVFAKTDTTAGARGVSAFILDRDTPGLEVGRAERLMGIRGAHAFEVRLDCTVAASQQLGTDGSGFRTAMLVLDNSRLDVCATAIGIAEAALDAAIAWARERQVAGKPLATRQGIQWMIADMKTRLEAAWALTMHAVALRTAGQRFTQQSSMAKLFATEMVAYVTDTALQIHGGYGFTRDLPLERYVRDARILRIYEGSSEIQRTVIARTLLA